MIPVDIEVVWRKLEASQAQCVPWQSIDKATLKRAWLYPEYPSDTGAGGAGQGVLSGLTFGVKDNIDVEGYATTCGSPLYVGDTPRLDAACVARLRSAGAIPVGKTVTAEFAFQCSGPTRNPWSTAHTAGGSSSGSAAAVACGVVDFALGTRTGGSVIRPAAYCGVFGFKPTRGVVHRGGVHLLADSLDTIGWFARSLSLIKKIAEVLMSAGYGTSLAAAEPRIAIIRAEGLASLEASTHDVINEAIGALKERGLAVSEISVDNLLVSLDDCHRVVMRYEMAHGLWPEYSKSAALLSKQLLDAIDEGRRISGQRFVDARVRAQQLETALLDELKGFHWVLTPSAPGEAPKGLANTGNSVFNRVWSMSGWPSLHLPLDYGPAGLPLGLQLVGRPYTDHALLDAASTLHQLLDLRAGIVMPAMGAA